MANCANQKNNIDNCTCTYSCDKRGNCCACVMYHRKMGQVPGCFFTKAGEATYDRSVAALARDHGVV
jgi:hypothetical protein